MNDTTVCRLTSTLLLAAGTFASRPLAPGGIPEHLFLEQARRHGLAVRQETPAPRVHVLHVQVLVHHHDVRVLAGGERALARVEAEGTRRVFGDKSQSVWQGQALLA